MTGLKCPGCGVMRPTHELLHLRLGAAWRQNALWVLSLPLVAYLAVSESHVCSGGRPLPGNLPPATLVLALGHRRGDGVLRGAERTVVHGGGRNVGLAAFCWGDSCTATPEKCRKLRWQYNCHPNRLSQNCAHFRRLLAAGYFRATSPVAEIYYCIRPA